MRSHTCAELNPAPSGPVTVCGWVNNRRDHGGVIFIDLRDASGQIQVVNNPGRKTVFAAADEVRSEYVLQITGLLQPRPEGSENPNQPNGHLELIADQLVILNRASALPFRMDQTDLSEAVRLKHRFLDLRRPGMQRNLRLRHRVLKTLRAYLDRHQFTELETPMLTRATPEGARDYLVPSRVYPGSCFALPQSPQLFKQLLVIGGFERYYQIARCFRDEDLRADRQPEFTQLDIEMAFTEETSIMPMMEAMVRELFAAEGIDLPDPFPHLRYAEALAKYGTDRPDLRIPLLLTDLTDLMQKVEFKVFAAPANNPGGRVAVLRVPGGGEKISRAQIDHYTELVCRHGAKGLAYIRVNQLSQGREGLQSPIVKFLSDDVLAALIERCTLEDGDLLFFGADQADIVNPTLSLLRQQLGQDLELQQPGWQPLWITDFPLLEYSAEQKRWVALHHPFTAPREEDLQLLETDPGQIRARAYDMVLNGSEIGGGSVRNHRADVQQAILKALGFSAAEAEERFGFLLDALKFGAPPHGGIAFGLDRITAMLAGCASIRDVIAFPKTQRATCLLTGAPSPIEPAALAELGLKAAKQNKN